MLTNRINKLSESITIAISTKAKEMKAAGIDVVSLSAGEPDFDTPKAIKDAVISALNSGCGKYTAVPGTPEVLNAIASKLKRDNNLNYKPSQIITNVGAKHSLFNCIECLVQAGDEVIVPSPYWVSYTEMIKFAGGTPVEVKTSAQNKFKITPDELKAAITPRTKILMLNSPSNPAGSVYTKGEIAALGELLKGTKIIVLSDEIYEKLTYNGEFISVASVSEDLFSRTVTINGLSKCGAMPGWRFGYMASPMDELNAAVKKLQSQSTSNISSIVQAGALPALLGDTDADIAAMHSEFKRRRDWAVAAVNAIDGLKVVQPDGAFYLFVDCSAVEADSVRFCSRLLEEGLVATVPGSGFGMDGYFRASFATDMASLQKGINRIADFVKNYR